MKTHATSDSQEETTITNLSVQSVNSFALFQSLDDRIAPLSLYRIRT